MKFLTKVLKNTLRDKSIKRYIKFNKLRFNTSSIKTGKIILIELGTNFTGTIALSYFTNYWHERSYKLVGYLPMIHRSYSLKILHLLLTKIPIDNGKNYPYKLARSIGIESFFVVKYNNAESKKTKLLAKTIVELSNKDILYYEIDGIRVGDLFYDWHLRKRSFVTLNTKSKEIIEDLCLFIQYFDYWYKKLDSAKISTVVISHSVYLQGVPARIALNRGIEVLLISYDRVNRLNNDLPQSDLEYKLYDPDRFHQLGYKINLEKAKESLSKLNFINNYNFKVPGLVSGFNGLEKEVIKKYTNKPKVLIAPHCFTDSPHASGDFLFNDYWEWLAYIFKKSQELNYDWYVKPHPAFLASERREFDNLYENYSNVTLIESSISNKSVFTQGLDVVLTVQGSIGFDAALYGILSICCSRNIPTQNYNISLCAGNEHALNKLLEDIPSIILNKTFDENKLLHFYDLHILRKEKTWLLKDKSSTFFLKFNQYHEIFQSPKVFDIWLDEFYSNKLDSNRKSEVRQFLGTNNYLLEIDSNKI